MSRTPQDIVGLYLRAQNLEQVRRTEEAVALYEEAIAAGFDSAGPYDRLIAIYLAHERHSDVVRVAAAAVSNVRTFPDKRAWYETVQSESREAHAARPDPRGAEF
jgi:hypothetical protein